MNPALLGHSCSLLPEVVGRSPFRLHSPCFLVGTLHGDGDCIRGLCSLYRVTVLALDSLVEAGHGCRPRVHDRGHGTADRIPVVVLVVHLVASFRKGLLVGGCHGSDRLLPHICTKVVVEVDSRSGDVESISPPGICPSILEAGSLVPHTLVLHLCSLFLLLRMARTGCFCTVCTNLLFFQSEILLFGIRHLLNGNSYLCSVRSRCAC